ncbi:hypothetical protein SARC_10419 [Sphaeroforma arctica JP610]|uniref:Uncharacterized protein n=1 Tax=Sphaeroforma arctica JP610 TaxID=667725 RepID=A0A0L0FK16_9EUKA|nr:hypothetical protein SARC_10419 [Sphaeroforma arctica JP610]KNC77112.1 hypothetical protein SARC_10419 [Sphaeroforma arctica JP610]|eukprot:XP_014151014.1 hypothetical protein SARC_10419 [Sphaeroforma arctica JP610]
MTVVKLSAYASVSGVPSAIDEEHRLLPYSDDSADESNTCLLAAVRRSSEPGPESVLQIASTCVVNPEQALSLGSIIRLKHYRRSNCDAPVPRAAGMARWSYVERSPEINTERSSEINTERSSEINSERRRRRSQSFSHLRDVLVRSVTGKTKDAS